MPGPRSYWGGYVRFVSIVERSLGVALGELGAFVARRPNATLAFSLFAAFALSSGLTNIAASQESDSETLWCALVPSMYPTGCTWQTWNSLECTPLHPSPPSRRLRKNALDHIRAVRPILMAHRELRGVRRSLQPGGNSRLELPLCAQPCRGQEGCRRRSRPCKVIDVRKAM
jgi:hypothetical protein